MTMTVPPQSSLESGDPTKAWAFLEHLPPDVAKRAKAGDQFVALDVPLTEGLAGSLREGMAINRRLSRAKKYALVRAARDGKWNNPHIDPLGIGPDGRMHNGMHRCEMRLEIAADVLVDFAFNVPRMDHAGASGSFSAATLLTMRGETNAHALATLGGMLFRADQGLDVVWPINAKGMPDEVEKADTITHSHPAARKTVRFMAGLRLVRGLPRRFASYLHYRIARYDAGLAGLFVVALGKPLADGVSPLMRENVTDLREAIKKEEEKGWKAYPIRARFKWLMQTWAATEGGRAVGQFTWTPRDKEPPFTPPRRD